MTGLNKEINLLYEFYLREKEKEQNTDIAIKNFKIIELALLRLCIAKLLKESEA